MSTEENKNELLPIETKAPYIIEKKFFSNRSSKQINLIESDPAFKFTTRNIWYEFKLEVPIYCTKILLKSENKSLKGTIIECYDPFGKNYTTRIHKSDGGNIFINPSEVITGFRIQPEKRRFNKIIFTGIVVEGYAESDFNEIEKKAKQYLTASAQIEERKTKLLETENRVNAELEKTNAAIIEKNMTLQGIESEIEKSSEKFEAINGDVDHISTQLSELKDSVKEEAREYNATKNSLTQATSELDETTSKLVKINTELRKKERDVNLIAYEVEDYIKQGNRDKQTYIVLSFLPWLLIAYVGWQLFHGAINIATTIPSNPQDIYLILLSRLPYTLIAAGIILASFKVSEIFVGKIIEINTQKLRLSELGIIAKDVSYASTEGLALSDEELFEVRTKLKMDLLRHHLKKLDPEQFEYNINPSLWDHFKKLISTKKDNKKVEAPKSDSEVSETESEQ